MRRYAFAVLAALAALGWLLGAASPALAGVDDFSYDGWRVEYRIGLSPEGRAVAHVTETVQPRFPDLDQNRGIVRGIPIDYQGASTDPRGFTVTDGEGSPVPFEVEHRDGFAVVLVGDDHFVHGLQTYVIGYTLSDVVLARDDGSADEFYWDVLDFERQQRIGDFSAEIAFAPELADALNGNARCYFGRAGSTDECAISAAGGGSFSIDPMPLSAGQGVTVAIGLEPGAVAQPPARLPSFALDALPLALGGLGIATAGAGAGAAIGMRRRRRTARGTIVAQYEVPPELPPLIAASIAGRGATASVPAEILHLAVNGAIRLEESEPEQGFFGRKDPKPVLRLIDARRAVDPLDQETLNALFGEGATPGTAIVMPEKDEKFAERMRRLPVSGAGAADARGYFTRERSPTARRLGFAALAIAVPVGALSVLGLLTRNSPTPIIAGLLALATVGLAIAGISRHRVHTRLGAETREHLEGVRLFIGVAEQERVNMLQSPAGAERLADGEADVIHLYERLLPYATLFGMERSWVQVLETRYIEQQVAPVWYPPAAVHGMSHLGGSLSQLTSSLNSSVSYTASSSGGSTGGGFAGGGGGGGFSGGR